MTIPWQGVPGYGVGDGSEDPIELTQHGPSVWELARYLFQHFHGDFWREFALVLHDKPPESHFYGCGEAGCEKVGWKLWVHG